MKINVGSGGTPLEGYINIDRKTGGEAFPLMQDGVVFDTGVADEIRASHVLEHFPLTKTLEVVKEWIRVLKPGGLLKIAVPDLIYATAMIHKHPHAPLWIMGGNTDSDDIHGCVFTDPILRGFFDQSECDMDTVESWVSDQCDCASLPVSLNLQVRKKIEAIDVPKPVVIKQRKIRGVMSCPRTGFMHTHGCIESIFSKFGIDMQMYFGAFWEQGIQNCLNDAIKDGYDDVITLDYDSVFDQRQFERMWSCWHNNPSIDALSCLQPQRGSGKSMLTPSGKPEGENHFRVEHEDSGMKCKTAHFGLTFIRLEKLKSIKKPWFWGQPDENGEWKKNGCVDADIYFWRKWEVAGNNLHVLTDVLLGHIEILIGQINPKTGTAVYRQTSQWNKDPYAGLVADVKDDKPKNPALDYDAMSVYHPEKDVWPEYDKNYGVCFHQRAKVVLGEPSKDFSGSEFQNVIVDGVEHIKIHNSDPRRILITFSGSRYSETTKAIVNNAPLLGVDKVYVYDDKLLIEKFPEFIEARKDIFYDADGKFTRGFGWFCWKPFIILDALERFCKDGDIVMFTDGDCYPMSDLKPFYDYTDEHGIMLFGAAGFTQGHWCKRDCDEVMGMSFRDKKAGNARYMAFKKGSFFGNAAAQAESFLECWMGFASNKKATTFEKSANEYPDLQQHRCEQAILTNLAHYHGIPLHRPPCEDGAAK